MTLPANIHWFAALALERLLYCLTGGIALGAVIGVVLRMLPGKNSRTRFAVWFSTLIAVALMPLMIFGPALRSVLPLGNASSHALIAIPAEWAEYIVLAWSALAAVGIARVLAGVWQLHRLRRACVPFDLRGLSINSQTRIAEVGKRRAVSLLMSSEVEVPTAIGFVHPAIVIPAWLAEESATGELDFVLLHELAHLDRWDDWSNLVQKLIKSVLFFHPAVWWIERNLSLDREIACDDAVLAQSANPRRYAECLAHVAEKRFLRRQIALAQAAVDRMKQLSSRVARILSSDGRRNTRLWKPAVPMVLGVAAICGVSTFKTTELVRFTEPQAMPSASASASLPIPMLKTGNADPVMSAEPSARTDARAVPVRAMERTQAKAWPAGLKIKRNSGSLLPAHHRVKKSEPSSILRSAKGTAPLETGPEAATLFMVTKFDSPAVTEKDAPAGAIVVVMAKQRIITTSSGTWQLSSFELRLLVPAEHPAKPIPRKT